MPRSGLSTSMITSRMKYPLLLILIALFFAFLYFRKQPMYDIVFKPKSAEQQVSKAMETVKLSQQEREELKELPFVYGQKVNECVGIQCAEVASKIKSTDPSLTVKAKIQLGYEYGSCFERCEMKFDDLQRKIEMLGIKDSCYNRMADYVKAGFYEEAMNVYKLFVERTLLNA
ncbi:hypothetical protein M513_06086 [Trichuris suis]|uniref:Uncharacterized protein n=1 Tax=Trichuris suis TaxID=68888 RepID=A0A085M6X4_9BILA|nr:hypothetical protein M513_06086 [Trichuris suis]